MFLVGLEIDKRLLKGKGPQMLIMAVAATAVAVAFGFLIAVIGSGRKACGSAAALERLAGCRGSGCRVGTRGS